VKPWLTDPKYGGMSEEAARKSYEAWIRQGRKVLPVKPPYNPETDEQIALRKAQIEVQLREYEEALRAAVTWHREWRARQRKRGFRCAKTA
jgi:hypothetical protein